jgi:N-methylhydantoinase A
LHAATLARSVGIPRVLIPVSPGLNCAMGMLQTKVRHSYLKSEIGMLAGFPSKRIAEIFAGLEQQALEEAKLEGFEASSVRLVRLLDLRYPHQGYTLAVTCPAQMDDAAKLKIKQDFDALHHAVYGQSAPAESAEIVTFRLQSEIEVPKLSLPILPKGDGAPARAIIGQRSVYDLDAARFVKVNVYDRQHLQADDVIEGPALVHQFDSTTVLLAGQRLEVQPTGALEITEAN